jgi:hypothetical protein
LIQITPFVSSSLEQKVQKTSTLSKDQGVKINITQGAICGKTGKTVVLPGFFKIEGGSGGALSC